MEQAQTLWEVRTQAGKLTTTNQHRAKIAFNMNMQKRIGVELWMSTHDGKMVLAESYFPTSN